MSRDDVNNLNNLDYTNKLNLWNFDGLCSVDVTKKSYYKYDFVKMIMIR